MTGGIFISYRRDDSRHAAGRLVERLERIFKRQQLFIDIDAIEPGLDFLKVINERISACNVCIALIGPGWLDQRNERGLRRLDDARDFVRAELEAALKRDIRVIPVLVDGASMPREEDLPGSLQSLASRQAFRLSHERFASDADELSAILQRIQGGRPGDNTWWPFGSPSQPQAAQPSTPQFVAAAIPLVSPAQPGTVGANPSASSPQIGFVDSIKLCLSNYAKFTGRARRSEFWWFVLFNSILSAIPFVNIIAMLGLTIPTLAAGARRLHDTGRTGWWQLLTIPGVLLLLIGAIAEKGEIAAVGALLYFLAIIPLLIWCATDTSSGPNPYGPPPK